MVDQDARRLPGHDVHLGDGDLVLRPMREDAGRAGPAGRRRDIAVGIHDFNARMLGAFRRELMH